MENTRYLALLRGVNVGGNAKVSMAELKAALTSAGFEDVSSYINSGNVIFSAKNSADPELLSAQIEQVIHEHFGFRVDVIVLTKRRWVEIMNKAPAWWGHNPDRKHNLIVLLKPYSMSAIMEAIGKLKPDIESVEPGEGVVYQSLSLEDFGKTTSGKLASNPLYKRMTIRNYNTATKLLALLD